MHSWRERACSGEAPGLGDAVQFFRSAIARLFTICINRRIMRGLYPFVSMRITQFVQWLCPYLASKSAWPEALP